MGAIAGQVEGRSIKTAAPGIEGALTDPARTLIGEQLLLLAERRSDGLEGRMSSAAQVVSNVLRREGRPALADAVKRTLATSLETRDFAPLAAALQSVLASEQDGAAPTTADANSLQREPRDGTVRVLRVDVERIDALVKVAGELTVAKNALAHAAQLADRDSDPKVSSPSCCGTSTRCSTAWSSSFSNRCSIYASCRSGKCFSVFPG